MNENIADKFVIGNHKIEHRREFELYLECDANDGDYIRDFIWFDEEGFRSDPLLQYVLAYIGGGSRFQDDPTDRWASTYGSHVEEDENFDWLEDYLLDKGLLLSSDWGPCHSIGYEIRYYDENGTIREVKVPDFDNLFEGKTREEMIEFMENLYEKDEEGK